MRPVVTIDVIEMEVPPSQLFLSRADSPFGPLLLASTTQGLAHLWLDMDGRSEDELRARHPKAQIIEQTTPHHSAALSYFTNAPQPLTLHLKGTPFQLSVWRSLLQIPFARASSYKVIAQKSASRRPIVRSARRSAKTPCFSSFPATASWRIKALCYYYGLEKKQDILNFEAARA